MQRRRDDFVHFMPAPTCSRAHDRAQSFTGLRSSNSSRFLLSLLSNLKLHRALRRHPTLYTSFCAHAGALFKHNFDVKFLSNTKSERLIWMCTHPGLETCVWSRTWWRRCPRGWTWSLACRDKQEVKTCHLSPSRLFAGGDLYTQSKMLEQFLLF